MASKNWFDITYNFIVTINHENFHLNHFMEGKDDEDHGTGISYNHALVIAKGLNHLATDAILKQQKILEKSDVIINELNQIVGYLPKGLDQRNLDTEINDLLKPVGYKLTLLRSIDGDKIIYKKND